MEKRCKCKIEGGICWEERGVVAREDEEQFSNHVAP
jgi:hypothetical protein